MAVSISIIDLVRDVTGETKEQDAAKKLQFNLEEEFKKMPDASGRIVLLTNVTFGGGAVGEIDIVLLCDLNNVSFMLDDPQDHTQKNIGVQRLCYVIEVKDHDHTGVALLGNGFNVKYNNAWSPASPQSRKQRFDLKNYLLRYLGYSPFVYNFIWFRELSGSELDSVIERAKDGVAYDDNALPKSFSFKKIVQKTIYVFPDAVMWNEDRTSGWINCCFGVDMIKPIVDHFTKRRIIVGKLTQKKLNLLAMKSAAQDVENVGDDTFTLFEGRAGTGKTIKLLQIAINLKNRGKRCLLLTYNRALISDLNRTLFLSGVYSKPGAPSVQTDTLHSFFLNLMCLLGVRNNTVVDDPNTYFSKGEYENDLRILLDSISQIMSSSDKQNLKDEFDTIEWDYILIDEAQDWLEEEKNIIFKVYGPNRIIVADGVDQFMRADNNIDWQRGLANIIKKKGNVCLRQKPNLVRFVNGFANEHDLDWSVEENDQYTGGKVIVADRYTTDIHAEVLNEGSRSNAEPYDVLFLVPPQDVKDEQFIKYDLYRNNGVFLFDGTNSKNRDEYPLDNSLCRLYQYESCRGLEGWTVICYDFDLLIDNKKNWFINKLKGGEMQPFNGASIEETANVMTYLWALMPLTRAVDTLVITLRDTNSDVGKLLRKMHDDKRHYDGIIDWRIN